MLTTLTGFKEVKAGDHMKKLESVVSEISYDWNNDGIPDKAVLIANPTNDRYDEGNIDFQMFLSETNNKYRQIILNNISGNARQPKLSLNKKNSLVLAQNNENVGAGNWYWYEKIIFSYRNKQLIISGYTYESWNRLSPDTRMDCDMNLLNGTIVANGKKYKLQPKEYPVPLIDDESIKRIPDCEHWVNLVTHKAEAR